MLAVWRQKRGQFHSYCYLGLCVKLSLDFFTHIPCSMQSWAGETTLSNFDPVQVLLGGGFGRVLDRRAVEDPLVSNSRLWS